MRSIYILLALLFFGSSVKAQDFSGTWIMAYVKSKQPVFTMIQENGKLKLEDDTPQDSTIVYSPGLMLMKSLGPDSAVSYSWDGAERWHIERMPDQIRFNGKLDSLYGNFDSEGKLVLLSTLDDVPNEYCFEPLKFPKSASKLDIENTSWTVSGESSFLTAQKLTFQKDSVLTSELDGRAAYGEYFIHPIGVHIALEFVVKTPATHIGIIYFNRVSRRKMNGVFYALTDDGIRPKRTQITLKR